MIRPQASITLWSVVVGGVLWTTTVAAQVPPDASWRSLETTHFRVTFPAELEAVARRAGERAERAYGYLSERLLTPPSGRIELLLTDHADQSNGFANALPFNRITVFVRPPMDGFGATHFDDWLETVVTHELVHIFHLDHTGPLGSLVRAVLGRSSADWPAFPGYDVPAWIGEGMATYYESALTESGRVNGSFNDMVLRTAMLEGRFEGPDQVSGLSPNWPAGARVYAYGASFFDHMLDAYGEERMGEFVDAIARQIIPWRVDSGAKDAFGIGFREAWSSWEDGLEVGYRAQADSLAALAPLTQGESIAGDGRRVLFPAVSPDGLRLGYLRSDGRSDIQLRVANPDGSDPRKLTRVNSVADWTWLPDGDLLVAEQEFTDPYRVRSDLVRVDRSGGNVGLRVVLDLPSPPSRRTVGTPWRYRTGKGPTDSFGWTSRPGRSSRSRTSWPRSTGPLRAGRRMADGSPPRDGGPVPFTTCSCWIRKARSSIRSRPTGPSIRTPPGHRTVAAFCGRRTEAESRTCTPWPSIRFRVSPGPSAKSPT